MIRQQMGDQHDMIVTQGAVILSIREEQEQYVNP